MWRATAPESGNVGVGARRVGVRGWGGIDEREGFTRLQLPSGGLEGVGMRAAAACGTPVAAAVVPAMAEADLAGLLGCQP